MRLRTRIALALVLAALLPAAAVGAFTLRTLDASFAAMFEDRLDDAERGVREELGRAGRELGAVLEGLAAGDPALAALARNLWLGTAEPADPYLAEGLLAGTGLPILFVLDARNGRVLSSGHLPARSGDPAPGLAALPDGEAVLRPVEVPLEGRIGQVLALLAARPAGGGVPGAPPLRLVGGRPLDGGFAERLARASGAAVTLLDGDGRVLARAGPGGGGALREIPLGTAEPAAARVRIALSDAPLMRARRRVLLASGVTGLGALLAALVAAALVSRRITRPVEALARAAGRVAQGDCTVRVPTRAGGEVGRLVTAFNGMTEEVERSRERIAAAERVAAWQEIARRLAHEIKNPLMPIATSIETLRRTWQRRHPQFEEIFQESTQAILEEVEALRRIVAEFSRFARLPAPAPAPVAPGELVDAALALFPEPPEGISLHREVEPGLPAVLADREQVGQVLLNLVTNAVQAIQYGRGRGRVTVRAAGGGDEVVLEVRDDGPGIDPAHLPELFTPYFTTKEGGTGLGLAICRRIVTEHGGRIEMDSRPGEGALFRVWLPASGAERRPSEQR